MSCARHSDTWGSRVAAVVADPRATLLAGVGSTLLVVGILVDRGELVVMGPAALLLAILLPVLAEFSFGTKGLDVTVRGDDTQASFADFVVSQRASLVRAATLLCDGAGDDVVADVEEALVRTSLHWHGDRASGRRHALCWLVHLTMAKAHRQGVEDEALADLRKRVLLVLHHDEQLDLTSIATMLGRPENEVREDAVRFGVLA